MNKPRPIELLAPARDAATAIAAIDHGADAVYIGAPSHGARAAATNSIDDIRRVVDYAHRFQARVYCTVNTIIYDNELDDVERLVWELYRIGVDALIVQDMALLRMDLPPIALHASTQCDTRTAAKARFLQDVGFSQIVLARELSIKEIEEIHRSVDVALEVFVHGALCVSYSGDCHASWVLKGRSANRGECAQICRLPWRLVDGEGNEIPVAAGCHLLSLRDMNRSRHVAELLAAGVSSFKIEGRLKDVAYVKNVVAAYRRIIDGAIAAHPDLYCRSSLGQTATVFIPDLDKSFNRGYTDYFMRGRSATGEMGSLASPKSIGTKVGVVESADKRAVMARLTAQLANGDGLGYFNRDEEFQGFRLNRIEGEKLYPRDAVHPSKGTALYRNYDKAWSDMMGGATATRRIPATFTLRYLEASSRLVATMRCGDIEVTTSLTLPYQQATRPQSEHRRGVMSKLGDTVYAFDALDDALGNLFVPASTLTALRRQVVDLMDRTLSIRHEYDYRRPEKPDAELPGGETVTYHDNVANRLARRFYTDHGATDIQPALECAPNAPMVPTRIMTTRYCLRRELGACLKTPDGGRLPRELYLVNGNVRLRLDFDCKRCQMSVAAVSR